MAWLISCRLFITNGPCLTTGSPIGLPCNSSTSVFVLPASSVKATSGRTRTPTPGSIARPPTVSESPSKKYKVRLTPASAGGSFHVAPADITSDQIATSEPGLAAQECGGGLGAMASSTAPAMIVTSVLAPSTLLNVRRGMLSFQNIAKCGSANLFAAGRLIQI